MIASPGARALRGVYYAFVLSIPLETMIYFKTDEDGQSGVSLSRLLGLLLFGLALVYRRLCLRKIPAAFWLVAWYLAAFTLSQLWVPSQLDARFRELQVTLIQLSVLFLISVNLFADEDFHQRLLRAFGWGMSVVALAMLAGAFGLELDAESRGSFKGQNPNVVGGLFAFGALCLAGDPRLIGAQRRLGQALASLLAMAVLVAGVMRTGSRGALLAFAVGIAGLAVCGARTTRAARAVVTLLVIGVLGLLLRREFKNATPMAARLERSVTEGDSAGRTGIYDAAWAMFLERPLFGYGGANNRFVLGTHLNYATRDTGRADRDAHNTFLAVLTEVGLVGGLPFIAALLLGLWRGWRCGRRTGDALPFALMCALLVASTVGTGSRQKLFWIVFATAVASGSRPGASRRKSKNPCTAAIASGGPARYDIAHG